MNLGEYLYGVQHTGITVENLERSIEFYTEILGGVIVYKRDSFVHEVMQHTLFQKEELDAIAQNLHPRTLGVVDIKDGNAEAMDICFISFGNLVVELIHFRNANGKPSDPNILGTVPTIVTYTNSMHLSFHVKDNVDLSVFAKSLEEECEKRGFNNVQCNRVIHVKSPEDRKKLALKYYANKFWNEADSFIEGYSDLDFGKFEGWSLVYCKGPSGEQLEFNQVRLKAKELFTEAKDKYYQLNQSK
jgi:catechol 2,3-dioxygenase-like lactoylglutathione lyase family enzyme